MKKNFLKHGITIGGVCLIVIFVFFQTYSSRQILKKHSCYSIKQLTIQKAAQIDSVIDSNVRSVLLYAQFISGIMTDKNLTDPVKTLDIFAERLPFDRMDYIRYDGQKFINSYENLTLDSSGKEYFKKGINGSTGVFVEFPAQTNTETQVNFYTPIRFNGEPVGVLTGVSGGSSSLKSLLKSSFYGSEVVEVLVDDEYRVISSSRQDISQGLYIDAFRTDKLINDVIDHIKNKDNNSFSYVINGKEGIACVSSLENINWHLITVISPVTISALMNELTGEMLLLSSGVALILLIILSSHIYSTKKASKEIVENQLNVINAMCIIYENIYSINMENSDLYVYRMSEIINSKYGKTFPNGKYEDAIAIYTRNDVYEEDHELFEAISDVKKVAAIFEKTNEYGFRYRVVRDDHIHYFQCVLLKPSKDSNEFVAGFKNVDQMVIKQNEDQNRMNQMIEMQQTQLSILSSISGIYLTTHLINLENDTFGEFNTIEEVRKIVKTSENCSAQMEDVMRNLIDTVDQGRMISFTNLSTLPDRLKGKKIISEEFRGKIHGWCRGSFITVEVDSDEMPIKVLFVTQVIEAEKRREQTLINKANLDELSGLLNRNAYEEELQKLGSSTISDNFVYVSMDLNALKTTNDSLGHEAGDELIQGAAQCIEETFGPYGKVFRTGGDEFQALIYVDENKLENLKKDFIEKTEKWSGNLVSILKISTGYASYAQNREMSLKELGKLADQRMYQQKSLYYSSNGADRRGQQLAYDVLCSSYSKILKINLTTDSFSVIKIEDEEKDSIKGFNKKLSKWFFNFGTSSFVHKNDQKKFLEKTDLKYLRSYFNDGNKLLNIKYRRKIGEEFNKVYMEIIPSKEYTNDNQVAFLYVKSLEG